MFSALGYDRWRVYASYSFRSHPISSAEISVRDRHLRTAAKRHLRERHIRLNRRISIHRVRHKRLSGSSCTHLSLLTPLISIMGRSSQCIAYIRSIGRFTMRLRRSIRLGSFAVLKPSFSSRFGRACSSPSCAISASCRPRKRTRRYDRPTASLSRSDNSDVVRRRMFRQAFKILQ